VVSARLKLQETQMNHEAIAQMRQGGGAGGDPSGGGGGEGAPPMAA